VHADARFAVSFQRTLRVPDDGHDYPLPAGLGRFPLEHVDDHAARVPETWRRHGGVMLPMHRVEALWINFEAHGYPMAVKVAAGMVNAVDGQPWSARLTRGAHRSSRQNYLVLPEQPWLDGFNVGEEVIWRRRTDPAVDLHRPSRPQRVGPRPPRSLLRPPRRGHRLGAAHGPAHAHHAAVPRHLPQQRHPLVRLRRPRRHAARLIPPRWARQRRQSLPDNDTVPIDRVIHLGRRGVRPGEWS
jgi:hypothetical protein